MVCPTANTHVGIHVGRVIHSVNALETFGFTTTNTIAYMLCFSSVANSLPNSGILTTIMHLSWGIGGRPFQSDVVVHDSQEEAQSSRLRDADAVLALLQQAPPDRELEAPLHAVDAVPRDRVAVADLRRREHAASAPPRAAPFHLHPQSGHVSGCEGDAQSVGAVCHDMAQLEPYLPCCGYTAVANLPANLLFYYLANKRSIHVRSQGLEKYPL